MARMPLLEREALRAELDALLREARAGRGAMLFLSGEAGAGKTSLLHAFASAIAGRVLWGSCDPLSLPRPLGRAAGTPASRRLISAVRGARHSRSRSLPRRGAPSRR
jgi:predicted ATPase